MGAMISRHLRDLSEVAGCEVVEESTAVAFPSASAPTVPVSSSSRPCTPASSHKPRALHLDPRSPTAEIVRTPLEIMSTPCTSAAHDSPMNGLLISRRSYLETDLDSLATQEFTSRPFSDSPLATPKHDVPLPAGLSHAHLLKLRFLGIDPRSPSAGIMRTPIQVKSESIDVDDCVSVHSTSSQDLANLSTRTSSSYDFSRDCSDPSAFISDNEVSEEIESGDVKHTEDTVELTVQDVDVCLEELPTEDIKKHSEASKVAPPLPTADDAAKHGNKLLVFCEDDSSSSQTGDKKIINTPDNSSSKRLRTPLTPLCNQNLTPNNIIRAKQAQGTQKEKIAKVKIYNNDENANTPSTQALATNKNITATKNIVNRNSPAKSNRKMSESGGPRQRVLAQWDHDSTIII